MSQGGILSPLLYVVYTKNLGKGMDKELQMLQYADDIIIYNMGNGRKEQRKKLEEGIKVLGKRLRELNLDIEPKKTQFMVFGVKGQENGKERSIIVEGKEIRNKREARFLGLLMNEELNFEKHQKEIRERMIKANGLLKYMELGKGWK